MNSSSLENQAALSRFKLLLALSRTPHGLLDLATPALGAVLWLGSLPSPGVIALGLVTAFAGYTAVYALNDLVDYRMDREKMRHAGCRDSAEDLDAVYVRHPLAQGLLSLREGFLWTGAWALVALIGAWLLNPICATIFLAAACLEIGYCLLLRVSHLRVLISGAVKTSGGIAAVFAVDPRPSFIYLAGLFLWLFLWEIGGQNVPNDWTDVEEDRFLAAKTLPVSLGPSGSIQVIMVCLPPAVVLSLVLYWLVPAGPGVAYLVGAVMSGAFLLLIPAHRLFKSRRPEQASDLFNRASYYPLAMLGSVVAGWIF